MKKGLPVNSAQLERIPYLSHWIHWRTTGWYSEIITQIEDDDDVQHVYTNIAYD